MLCACSKKLFAILQCCILFCVSGNCNHLLLVITILSCAAVMVILFIYLLLRGPATPWGDVSQALIYHQVGSEIHVYTCVCAFVDLLPSLLPVHDIVLHLPIAASVVR